MSSTLTASKLINWINANTASQFVVAATPSSESLALIQQCLDAAIASVESYCDLPDVYPVDVEVAVLILAASIWERRRSPDGIAAVGDFGAVRVNGYDNTVKGLLEPYRAWRFSK